MSDLDVNLSQETLDFISGRRLTSPRPNPAGTPGDPYDLTAPASVIVPVATPLVNELPRIPVAETAREDVCLAAQNTFKKSDLAAEEGDARARHFAELIYALKLTEQRWLEEHLPDVSQPWKTVRVGVTRDYYGYQEDLGDDLRFTAAVGICLLTD